MMSKILASYGLTALCILTAPGGDGGPATDADLAADDVAVNSAGNLYIAGVSPIRKVTTANQ
jgi:hypothetical protein